MDCIIREMKSSEYGYAVMLYKKVGFEVIDENDEEYIMRCRLDGIGG